MKKKATLRQVIEDVLLADKKEKQRKMFPPLKNNILV